jgi:hypothetical protein
MMSTGTDYDPAVAAAVAVAAVTAATIAVPAVLPVLYAGCSAGVYARKILQ